MRKKLNGRVLAGLVILSVVLLVALLAPVLAPHDPYELGVPYLRPSAEHPLGTNDIGQDILSELIYGTRISLLIGVVSALAVTVVGTALGILSGYLGGWTDQIIMQVTNVAMALPSLPLTIILVPFWMPTCGTSSWPSASPPGPLRPASSAAGCSSSRLCLLYRLSAPWEPAAPIS